MTVLLNSSDTKALFARIKGSDLLFLLVFATGLLCILLGAREIWTLEWRWAGVTLEMLARHDYFHPYFLGIPYYDKPLLSYWFILLSTFLTGGLTEWSLRIPSVLAGITSVWCTYWLGNHLFDRRTGITAGWILLTTYSFIFWSRTASADILNICGILLALVWYFSHKERPTFKTYSIFFIILALTSLIKGLVGVVLPLLIIAPDLLNNNHWKKHLKLSLFLATIPAVMLYVSPFVISNYYSSDNYAQNGLWTVFRENVVRYFEPFDHRGSLFTYFIYLPLYLLPWTPLFAVASYALIKNWRNQTKHFKYLMMSLALLFLFFTFSGSRRSYYILPLLPFTSLVMAYWCSIRMQTSRVFTKFFYGTVTAIVLLMSAWFFILQPIYYVQGGVRGFTNSLRKETAPLLPWGQWDIVLFDAKDKIIFYLTDAHSIKQVYISDSATLTQKEQLLRKYLAKKLPPHTLFIAPERYRSILEQTAKNSLLLSMPFHVVTEQKIADDPIALIEK